MTAAETDAVLDREDPLEIAIRGHQAIEALLDLAISESLPAPHVLEVAAINFALKVDLAVALGLIAEPLRGIFLGLNSARNAFAHNPQATFDRQRALDLVNQFPLEYRRPNLAKSPDTEPLLALRWAIAVAFVTLENAVTGLRDACVRAAAMQAEIEPLLERAARRGDPPPRSPTVSERVEETVRQERERRVQAGEL